MRGEGVLAWYRRVGDAERGGRYCVPFGGEGERTVDVYGGMEWIE